MSDYGHGTTPAADILLGGGNLEYCLATTGDVETGTWVGLGYTKKEDGATLSIKPPSFKDIKVTGLTDPVKRHPMDREVTLKATLMQCTMENIALATGGLPADVSSGALITGKTAAPKRLKFRYSVPNADDAAKSKRVYIPIGEIIEATELKFQDDEAAAISVTIQAIEVSGGETPAIVFNTAPIPGARVIIVEEALS